MMNIKLGSVLLDVTGQERQVLGIIDRAILLSRIDHFDEFGFISTYEELLDKGYTLKVDVVLKKKSNLGDTQNFTTIGPAEIIKNQDKWLIDQILVNEGQEAVITGVTSEGKYILSSLATQDYLTAEGWKPKIIALDKQSIYEAITELKKTEGLWMKNEVQAVVNKVIEILEKF